MLGREIATDVKCWCNRLERTPLCRARWLSSQQSASTTNLFVWGGEEMKQHRVFSQYGKVSPVQKRKNSLIYKNPKIRGPKSMLTKWKSSCFACCGLSTKIVEMTTGEKVMETTLFNKGCSGAAGFLHRQQSDCGRNTHIAGLQLSYISCYFAHSIETNLSSFCRWVSVWHADRHDSAPLSFGNQAHYRHSVLVNAPFWGCLISQMITGLAKEWSDQ